MRKLLSIGTLLAVSGLGLWNPQPAAANTRVIIVYHHNHHRYHHRYYRRGYWHYY